MKLVSIVNFVVAVTKLIVIDVHLISWSFKFPCSLVKEPAVFGGNKFHSSKLNVT